MQRIGEIIKSFVVNQEGERPIEQVWILCPICKDESNVIETFALIINRGLDNERRMIVPTTCSDCRKKYYMDGDFDEADIIEMTVIENEK